MSDAQVTPSPLVALHVHGFDAGPFASFTHCLLFHSKLISAVAGYPAIFYITADVYRDINRKQYAWKRNSKDIELAGSGSHSLWAFVTYIIGETPFPEFTAVVMLDDVQVGYYDSNDKQTVPRGLKTPLKTEDDLIKDGTFIFEWMYNHLKMRSFNLRDQFNLTEGVQVQQRISGCEMLENGEPTMIMERDTFNSDQMLYQDQALYYNITHFTFDAGKVRPYFDDVNKAYLRALFGNIFLPICTKTMKALLKREKNIVMRIVRPRLRLLKKDVSGGVRVTCLAYGFYPRHINLTLVRDDQPVAEQELTGGEVLPSGDGTYQMRKTLEVSTEELNERHHYSCTASHLSLDNKLDVSWDSEAEKVQLSILSALIVIVLAVILLAILICMKRRHTSQQSLRHPASSDGKVEQILLTSDSQT